MTAASLEPPADPDADDLARTVARGEAWDTLVPAAIVALGVFGPLVAGLVHGHAVRGLVTSVVLGACALLIARFVSAVLIAPLRAVRHHRICRRLATSVGAAAPDGRLAHRWTVPTPGMAVVRGDRGLLLADRSTGYRCRSFSAFAVRRARVLDRSVETIRVRPALSLGVGVPIGGLVAMVARAPRPHVTVRHAPRIWVELVLDGAPAPIVAAIPFGADAAAAQRFVAAIGRPGGERPAAVASVETDRSGVAIAPVDH